MSTRQLAIFKIGSEEFGIEIDRISSIEQMLEIFKIPNSPEYIEGMVNLRGKVHTVINLRKRFGMQCPESDENSRIIMVHSSSAGSSASSSASSSAVTGIIVDTAREIIKVEDSDFDTDTKPKSGSKNKFVCGSIKNGGRTILLLDVDKVLA